MDKNVIFIVAGIILLWVLIIICIKVAGKKKSNKENNLVDTTKGRYTANTDITKENGQMNVSYAKNDEILKQGETYIIDKKNGFRPGKYTILSTVEGIETINIRIGGFVRSFKHGTSIVISDGEEITPISNSIILR